MKFPNAANGVKKIFTAEILSLISSVCVFVTIVLMLAALASTAGAISDGSDGAAVGALASGAGTVVFGIATVVLAIIAFILNIVGITKASKDEESFKMALYALIGGIILSVIGSAFTNVNGYVSSIMQALQVVADLLVLLYVIQGVRYLALKLNRPDIDQKGQNLFKIIFCVLVLQFIARMVVVIFGGQAASVPAAVIALIAVVLSVVQYSLYLAFLAKAKKMLAEG